jgi:cyanophycinase
MKILTLIYVMLLVLSAADAQDTGIGSQRLQSVNAYPMLDANKVYSPGQKIKFEEPHGVFSGLISMDGSYFFRFLSVTETERQQYPGSQGFFGVKGTVSASVRLATSSSWQNMTFSYGCDDRELKVGRIELGSIRDGNDYQIGDHNAVCILKHTLKTCETGCEDSPTVGPAKGWLVIHGGGALTNEMKERFVALAGGPNANFVVIPTALTDKEIDLDKYGLNTSKLFGITHVTVLHTKDHARANSEGFVEPLRHASGVWIDGGRQWRLADAYLGTAVEREIKSLLARGGVVCGSSAGATIQGSFLVRGASGTPNNPDGDNSIMMAPGHETGFGLLANSAIDQHIDARGREGDLHAVISKHPNLLGIGIDQSAAIVVHGDSFFVVGGQVAIHDGKQHQGSSYYFLSSGQAFDLKTRSVLSADMQSDSEYPLTLTVTSANRSRSQGQIKTIGVASLEPRNASNQEVQSINFECNVSLYSVGKNFYPARLDGPHQITIKAREVDSDKLREFTCKH